MSGAHDSNPIRGGAAKVFASHIHAVGQRHTFSRQPKRVARIPAVDRALYGFNDAFTATTGTPESKVRKRGTAVTAATPPANAKVTAMAWGRW